MTDSATGGYLAPQLAAPFATPLEDDALQAFMEAWVVGITGLAADLVRPRWQPTPPQQVALPVDWVAVGITEDDGDWMPAVQHRRTTIAGVSADVVQRHAVAELLCSFYGPNAGSNASRLRQGIGVAQNREPLQRAGFGWQKTGNILNLSEDRNGQYYRRLDMIVYMVRNITLVYPVDDIVSSSGKVMTSNESANWATVNVKGN